MRIFLIGFMGVGKTHLGQQLAMSLGFQFLDLDQWLEHSEGRSIGQIFSEDGEEKFRLAESACLKSTGQFSETVIATGGGTPCFHDNLSWMLDNGFVIYLEASPDVIFSRLLKDTGNRPLLAGKSEAALLNFIKNKLSERRPFYESAHLQLSLSSDPEGDMAELVKFLKRFTKS